MIYLACIVTLVAAVVAIVSALTYVAYKEHRRLDLLWPYRYQAVKKNRVRTSQKMYWPLPETWRIWRQAEGAPTA